MKRLIIITIMSFAFLANSNAQEQRRQMSPEQRAERVTQRMTRQLALTKEQQENIYQLSLEQFQKSKSKRSTESDSISPMKERMAMNREKIESVLTAEQKEKWTELRTKENNERRQRFKRKPEMYKKADSVKSSTQSRMK